MSHVLVQETALAGSGRAVRLGATAERWILPLGAAAAVAGVGAANGGFFPVSWNWASLAFLWATAIALLLRSPSRLRTPEAFFLATLAGLSAWTWISISWAGDVAQAVDEGERSLVLVAGVAAVFALASRQSARLLLGGVLTGIVVVSGYALSTRLFPGRVGTYDPLAVYRLNTPVGYWNGLGILAVVGVLVALGFALRSEHWYACALASASLLVLLPTLYFTYSRGSWLALGAGLAVALALDRRRLELATGLIAVSPAPVLAIWLASRSHALTRQSSSLASARHDGHRIGLVILGLAIVEALVAVGLALARRRVAPPRAARMVWAAVLAAVLLGALAAAFERYGSPPTLARRAYHAFVAPPPSHGADLNTRLFSLSSNGRVDLWRAAWHEAEAHPWLGAGAGGYERYWVRHRPTPAGVQDAHNLYVETLAELGPVGLALLVLALGAPLVGAFRAREHPLVPLACAAYAAYLVHAIADWDWELAGVTLAAVLCGLACLLAGRDDGVTSIGPRARVVGIGVATVLAGLVFVALLGNTALAKSDATAGAGHWHAAEHQARKAIRWTPWSSEGWQRLAEAQTALHDRAAARRSLARGLAKDSGDWVLWLDLAGVTRGAAQATAIRQAFRLNPRGSELVPYVLAVIKR
jgi:hypothetical protein